VWTNALAGAVVVGLELGAAQGLAAGALVGAIPLVSAALSVTDLTDENSGFLMALLIASIGPAALAGGLSSLIHRPAVAPEPGLAEPDLAERAGSAGVAGGVGGAGDL
jgi:hypothetical protein